jgi:hypothetical protein
MKGALKLDYTRTFAVVLQPEEVGGFTVRVPAIPEIVTYGGDEREALAMRRMPFVWCLKTVRPAASRSLPASRHASVK